VAYQLAYQKWADYQLSRTVLPVCGPTCIVEQSELLSLGYAVTNVHTNNNISSRLVKQEHLCHASTKRKIIIIYCLYRIDMCKLVCLMCAHCVAAVCISEDPGKEPEHMVFIKLHIVESRLDYMGSSILMGRVSDLAVKVNDEWHMEHPGVSKAEDRRHSVATSRYYVSTIQLETFSF